jgi:hypothetical protein
MTDLSKFLRTEAKVRKANDDGIWELLEEAAQEIESLEGSKDYYKREMENWKRINHTVGAMTRHRL